MRATQTLESSRLILVPHSIGAVTQRQVDWLNDPDVVQFSEQRHRKHTIDTQLRYVASFPPSAYLWLITMKPEASLSDIGTLTADIDRHNKIANMGILIGEKSVWKQGYGLEAWTAAMDWLFEAGIRKVEAGCNEHNHAMCNLCFKAGMRAEGYLAQHFLTETGPAGMFLFGRVR